MLITEKQKQAYIKKEHLDDSLSNLLKCIEVKNLPEGNEPYVLKELFGSKRGLLVRASKLNKDIEKIYKEANKIRKKGIAPKYLSRIYLNELLDNNFISENEFIMIKGYEATLSDLEKEAKKLSRKIQKKINIERLKYDAIFSVVAMTLPISVTAICPFMVVLLPISCGIFVPTMMLAGEEGIFNDKSIDIRRIKSDYEKCQRNRMPGMSPYLVFLKDENGKIGLPLSHNLVVFEPQSDIKHFYDSYQRFTTNFGEFLETENAGLFFNPANKWKDIRPLWKALRDQEKLVSTTVSMAEKLVQKMEKSHKGKPSEDKKGKWKNSEIFIYSLAKYLTELTYKGLKPEELKTKLAKTSNRSLKSGSSEIQTFVETIKDNPTVEVKTSAVEALPLSSAKKDKKPQTRNLTIIKPHKYNLSTNVNQLVKKYENLSNNVLTSSPEDFSPLNV